MIHVDCPVGISDGAAGWTDHSVLSGAMLAYSSLSSWFWFGFNDGGHVAVDH